MSPSGIDVTSVGRSFFVHIAPRESTQLRKRRCLHRDLFRRKIQNSCSIPIQISFKESRWKQDSLNSVTGKQTRMQGTVWQCLLCALYSCTRPHLKTPPGTKVVMRLQCSMSAADTLLRRLCLLPCADSPARPTFLRQPGLLADWWAGNCLQQPCCSDVVAGWHACCLRRPCRAELARWSVGCVGACIDLGEGLVEKLSLLASLGTRTFWACWAQRAYSAHWACRLTGLTGGSR